MAFEIDCTACGEAVEVDDRHRGWRVRCPVCGSEFQAGEAGAAVRPEPVIAPRPGRNRPPDDGPDYRYSRRAAGYAVAGPATALKVVGWIGLGISVLCVLIWVAILAVIEDDPQAARNMNKGVEELYAQAGVYIVQGVLGFFASLIILHGATKLGRLESRGWATAAAVVAMIPCISPCCLLGLPFGIWALTVLNKPEVVAAFDDAYEPHPNPPDDDDRLR